MPDDILCPVVYGINFERQSDSYLSAFGKARPVSEEENRDSIKIPESVTRNFHYNDVLKTYGDKKWTKINE